MVWKRWTESLLLCPSVPLKMISETINNYPKSVWRYVTWTQGVHRHAQSGILIQAIWTTSWSGKISIYRDRYAVRTQSGGAWCWNVKLRVAFVKTGSLNRFGVAFLKNCTMDLATVRHTGQTPSIWWVQCEACYRFAHVSMVSFLIQQHHGGVATAQRLTTPNCD